MKRFFVLFSFLLFLIPSSMVCAIDEIPLFVENGGEVSMTAMNPFRPSIIMETGSEPINEWEWSSSDNNIVAVRPDNSIIALRIGSITLSGRAADGSGQSAKIKINVPKIYTSDDSITISSAEGAEFGYFLNTNGGFTSVSTSGDCFITERLDDYNGATMCRIIPVKAGTGSFIFKQNGKRIKTVKVTVKKSALETDIASGAEGKQEIAFDGEAVATVNKSVNIRSKANSDSKKVGSAKKDDQLLVTKAYYSDSWHQILYDGKLCYVSAKYCDIEYIEQTATEQEYEAAEKTLDQYIAEFGLSSECKTVIVDNLPHLYKLDRIERETQYVFRIYMYGGAEYYFTILKSGEPAWLETTERDWDTRTRYYDRFAK